MINNISIRQMVYLYRCMYAFTIQRYLPNAVEWSLSKRGDFPFLKSHLDPLPRNLVNLQQSDPGESRKAICKTAKGQSHSLSIGVLRV